MEVVFGLVFKSRLVLYSKCSLEPVNVAICPAFCANTTGYVSYDVSPIDTAHLLSAVHIANHLDTANV